MCTECGCGLHPSGENDPKLTSSSPFEPDDAPSAASSLKENEYYSHRDSRGDSHGQLRGRGMAADERRIIELNRSLLTKNERLAERNRGYFKAKGVFVLNVLSSPGSGKTTLIEKTVLMSASRFRTGVIVGDLATDNDAARFRSANIPAVQINTGTLCHLDAEMVEQACSKLDLDDLDLVIIENVGNLVCPAAYDLGENLRVVLLSVTEGEDKPLKYPPLFHSADVAIITKCDLAAAAGWNRVVALENLRRISHHATLFELSAKTGEGMDQWLEFLSAKVKSWRRT